MDEQTTAGATAPTTPRPAPRAAEAPPTGTAAPPVPSGRVPALETRGTATVAGHTYTLQQMQGRRAGPRGVEEVVRHPKDRVLRDGVVVAHLGQSTNAILCIVAQIPEAERKDVLLAARQLRYAEKRWMPNPDQMSWLPDPEETERAQQARHKGGPTEEDLMAAFREQLGEEEAQDEPHDET